MTILSGTSHYQSIKKNAPKSEILNRASLEEDWIMKIPVWIFALGAICFSGVDSSAAKQSPRSGLFFGAGYLNQGSFLIHNDFDNHWIQASASSPHIIAGYIWHWRDSNIGLSMTGGYSWFHPPNFSVEIYPGAPQNMQVYVDYTNVRFSLLNLDPSMVFYFAQSLEFDLGFCFGVQSTSAVRYTDPFRSDPVLFPGNQNRRWEDKDTIFVGGGGTGLTCRVSDHFAVAAKARWIVGTVSGSDYELLINGIPMGQASGGSKTKYLRQLSINLVYKL